MRTLVQEVGGDFQHVPRFFDEGEKATRITQRTRGKEKRSCGARGGAGGSHCTHDVGRGTTETTAAIVGHLVFFFPNKPATKLVVAPGLTP